MKRKIKDIYRVIHGGAWFDVDPCRLTAAVGYRYGPALRYFDLGFRLVRTR